MMWRYSYLLVLVSILALVIFRPIEFFCQEKISVANEIANGRGILTDAAEEVAEKLCEFTSDRPIVGRSIMSMDLALKKVEDASGGRIAVSILLLIPSLDGEDSNSLRKLHDENIDFFLHRFSSRNVTKPVATVTVSLVRTNGRFESGTFLVKI